MTKTAEVAALDRFIAELGPHSYLGPWLADQREDIVTDISRDVLPTPLLPSAAWRKAAQIVADARESATVITNLATEQANNLRVRTQTACDQQRHEVADGIVRAAQRAADVLRGR
jgi:hypothetical protein